ncbi:unnamed protein product [Musa textilis]
MAATVVESMGFPAWPISALAPRAAAVSPASSPPGRCNTRLLPGFDGLRMSSRVRPISPVKRLAGNLMAVRHGALVCEASEVTIQRIVFLGRSASVSSPCPATEPKTGSKEAPLEVEADRPRKKTKICASKGPGAAVAQPKGDAAESASRAGESLKRGEAGPSREVTGKEPRLPSVQDLCRLPAGTKDKPYQARAIGDLAAGEATDLLSIRRSSGSSGPGRRGDIDHPIGRRTEIRRRAPGGRSDSPRFDLQTRPIGRQARWGPVEASDGARLAATSSLLSRMKAISLHYQTQKFLCYQNHQLSCFHASDDFPFSSHHYRLICY